MKVAEKIQRERAELGARLRTFRMMSGRSVSSLAAEIGVSQSKLSRMELGQLPQSESDICKIALVLKLEQEITNGLIAQSRALRFPTSPHPDKKAVVEKVNDRNQVIEKEAKSEFIKEWALSLVPGRLQTPAYARVVHANQAKLFWKSPDTGVDKFLVNRMSRQAQLLDLSKKFMFVLGDLCLERPYLSPELMDIQYDCLIRFARQPNLELVIYPTREVASTNLLTDFVVYDGVEVFVETLTLSFVQKNPINVLAYLKEFDHLYEASYKGDLAVDFISSLKSST